MQRLIKSADATAEAVKVANYTFKVQKESVENTLLEMNVFFRQA